eukprot:s584_g15.t1
MLTAQDVPSALLQKQLTPASKPPATLPPVSRQHHPSKRFSVLQWNPGGMAQGTFLELRLWLRSNPVDIVILCETRWSFTATWQDDQRAYVHSASSDSKTGGILVMVHRHIIHPDHIGYHEYLGGRLLHVRLHFANRNLDILAAYQYVYGSNTEQRRLRSSFWKLLDRSLEAIPRRNQLICTGDYNCTWPEC